jgi:hypothetical protein
MGIAILLCIAMGIAILLCIAMGIAILLCIAMGIAILLSIAMGIAILLSIAMGIAILIWALTEASYKEAMFIIANYQAKYLQLARPFCIQYVYGNLGRDFINIYIGLARTVYIHRIRPIFGEFPAKNTIYTPYIYGSGHP